MQEFLALSCVQHNNINGSQKVPKVYQFYENSNKNFFTMELLGQNIMSLSTSKSEMNEIFILKEMLDAIEIIHNKGVIHLDIKPSNFVIGANPIDPRIYLIDFGLSQPYINTKGEILENKNADFIGTIKYASLNSHNYNFLGRRDDLWSLFFIILELLKVNLPWNQITKKLKDKKELMVHLNLISFFQDHVKQIKEIYINNGKFEIYFKQSPHEKNLILLLNYLKSLTFYERPDYNFIR